MLEHGTANRQTLMLRNRPLTDYVLALDQGTTSSRAILFDTSGMPVATRQQEFQQIYPGPGLVEHDPEEIWSSQLAVAQQVMSTIDPSSDRVKAIGITNQRETTIVWDRETGRPVHNAIVWQSRLTAPECERLKADGMEPLFQERTGLVLDAYFSGTKISWLLDNVSGLREKAERGDVLFGTVETYLLWRLTGGKCHATDVSNASRTLLFNLRTLDWDDELLKALRVPRAMLPKIVSNSEIVGESLPELFGTSIPIAGMAGDQQAATFGQCCFEVGHAKNTYGTGCFLLLNTGDQPVVSDSGMLTTVGWKVGDSVRYCLEGSVFIGGAAVQWLRDELQIVDSAAETEEVASTVSDTAGVRFVPAFVGLGAPYWDSAARGTLIGLTRGANRAHIVRATLDAIAQQVCDVLDAMAQSAPEPVNMLRVDGGASANNLLMQMQADRLGVSVVRPTVQETTARGAAYLAGLAVGVWESEEALSEFWEVDREFHSEWDASTRQADRSEWKKAVERSRNWIDTDEDLS